MPDQSALLHDPEGIPQPAPPDPCPRGGYGLKPNALVMDLQQT